MAGLGLLLTCIALLIGLGVLERWRHQRMLAQLPIRVHINGTRGKSSVTRLVAAGLRAGGIRTCAKTTGTLARMIMPDGSERPIFRPAAANVREQIRVVRAAVHAQAEALVIECMALQPALQSLCEDAFVQATHAVITNARPDHLDVMGPTPKDVAWALAGMIAPRKPLYTAEIEQLPILTAAAQDRAAVLMPIGLDAVAQITDADLAGFCYLEHRENLALALRICADLGVSRAVALQGMWAATPDPGAAVQWTVRLDARVITFVNAFAANDPHSTTTLWQQALSQSPVHEARLIVVNCRRDRPERTRQMAEMCSTWTLTHLVLLGTGTALFQRTYTGDTPLVLVEERLEATLDQVLGAQKQALVMGLGNIGGPGLEIVDRFHRRHSAQTRVGTLPQRGL